MRTPALSQRTRFVLLAIEATALAAASKIAFGAFFPPNGDKGFWFYTGLLGLIFGSRLDTPFFATPADAVLYASSAAIALALQNSWDAWDSGTRVAFACAVFFSLATAAVGSIAILLKDGKQQSAMRVSNAARVLAETLGSPRTIYTVVIMFALYAFHRDSPTELGVIGGAWVFTALLSPLEASVRVTTRLKAIFRGVHLTAAGRVVGYQWPGLVLVREEPGASIKRGDLLGVRDSIGGVRLALAVDHVGRDEGVLVRALELSSASAAHSAQARISLLDQDAVVRVAPSDLEDVPAIVSDSDRLVGFVAPDTSIETVLFDVTSDDDLTEGRLVSIAIGSHQVLYQVLGGLTEEEVVRQKNTFGYARAQAQKVGEWDNSSGRFKTVRWLPRPNAPVFLEAAASPGMVTDAIGHFPGTDYPVRLRTDGTAALGLNSLVTHNTAILGILGVGKSTLALELVERMLSEGIKVLCLDLTNQYAQELSPYFDAALQTQEFAALNTIGKAGAANVHLNVEEGGSVRTFTSALTTDLQAFFAPQSQRLLKILNPAQFEVWRQDSKPYQNRASMATLTPPEVTELLTSVTLEVVASLGMTDAARACIVYEEAHSLAPEWSSAVSESDRRAANGIARAILQGRKFGLGCLVITQRTANVTKSILNQCNTIFAMRTFDDTSKEFLSNYLGRRYAELLPSLEERHAVFFGKASHCENPVLIRLNDREAFLASFRACHPPPVAPGAIASLDSAAPAI